MFPKLRFLSGLVILVVLQVSFLFGTIASNEFSAEENDLRLISPRNFTRLGSLEILDETRSPKLISYFISQIGHELTHTEALLECRNIFFGRLLTLYTFEQDDYIRLRLQALNFDREQVHTAGRYNGDKLDWEWSTTMTPCYYKNWRDSEPSSTSGSCIQLLGASSSYGWVSRSCTNPHVFICEMVV